MNFDKRDRAIISALYHNWRIPSSLLGKKLKLSRRQVDYRTKQYFSSKVIRSIFTVVDYSKLGYNRPAYAFIKLNKKENVVRLGRYLENTKRCTSWGKVWTEYDVFSNLIFKDEKESSQFIRDIKNQFKGLIDKIDLLNPIHSELYPLKSLGSNMKETYVLTSKSKRKTKIDQIDLQILKEIESDARKPIIRIAEKIKISPERCLYRLRRLYNEKVILGSRIQFSLREAGYYATCLFIDTVIDGMLLKKIKILCNSNQNINLLIISSKHPKVIMQVFHKDEGELREVVKEVYSILSDNNFNISLIELEDDMNIINPLPFIKN